MAGGLCLEGHLPVPIQHAIGASASVGAPFLSNDLNINRLASTIAAGFDSKGDLLPDAEMAPVISLTDAKWCHPKLVVEVKHLAGSKLLRHATVSGFTQP